MTPAARRERACTAAFLTVCAVATVAGCTSILASLSAILGR